MSDFSRASGTRVVLDVVNRRVSRGAAPPNLQLQQAPAAAVLYRMPRERKITIGEMWETGPPSAIQTFSLRLSDPEERFVCAICGHRRADVRPLFEPARMGTDA